MESEVTPIMTTIIAAMADAFTLVGTVVTEITKQPVLLFLFAAGLIPIGFKLFKGMKRTAR